MNIEWIYALAGGVLIGLAVSIMLLLNGRVTGIIGIVYGLVKPAKGDVLWRVFFIGGLLAGGLVLRILKPETLQSSNIENFANTAIAGLLVGFGTVLGSGCTSGHGVCGISRLSVRSILATLIFIAAGVASVYVFKQMGVLL